MQDYSLLNQRQFNRAKDQERKKLTKTVLNIENLRVQNGHAESNEKAISRSISANN